MSLVTAYFYMNEYKQSQRAVKRFAPDAKWFYTPHGQPTFYPETVADLWNKGDDLLIVEGDIVPTPLHMQRMAECKAAWCTAWYELGTKRTKMPVGYGFTKFSAALQAEFGDYPVLGHSKSGCGICKAVDNMDCSMCGWSCCHQHQDTAMWHELINRSGNPYILPHDHGKVDHLHLGTRALVGIAPGVFLWEQDSGYTYEEHLRGQDRHVGRLF